MYEELIADLRHCADPDAPCSECRWIKKGCEAGLTAKAADAIEDLAAYVRQIEELRKDGYYLEKTKMTNYGQAIITGPLPQPPKEGEI